MKFLKYTAAALVVIGFSSCIPKAPAPSQKTITVTIEAPPIPPTQAELEKPPDVPIDKAVRDPFIVLRPGAGESAVGFGAPAGGGAGSSFVVTGIMTGRPYNSAILESGSASYIVHPGQRVRGYVVASVTKNSVTLINGKEKVTLMLSGGK